MALASEKYVTSNKIKPIAKVLSWASSAGNPDYMGITPITAIQKLMKKMSVNINYFMNTRNHSGTCVCSKLCNGKGNVCGDGECKNVTIAVFKSGKIIITGGQNKDQINESYRFITNFIRERKDKFLLK